MTPRIRPRGTKRLFGFVTRSGADIRDDVQEEFAFHLDMRVEDLMREGLPEPEARAQALREFGDRTRGVQACAREGSTVERQRTLARLASELRQDAIFGARLLRRSPGFSAVAIVTLALAIGGNTAIFSLVNALALKPMPVRAPAEVVRVYTGQSQTSWPTYEDIVARSNVFSDVAAHAGASLAMTTDDSAARLSGETTSTNYLTMLGVPALLGRTYLPSDTRTDVVVLGERAWRTRFASDPSIVGRRIPLGGRPFEIIGVMPRGFRGARPPAFVSDFWMPIDPVLSGRTLRDREKAQFQLVARLTPGVTVEQAQAATQVIGQQLAREHPGLGFDREHLSHTSDGSGPAKPSTMYSRSCQSPEPKAQSRTLESRPELELPHPAAARSIQRPDEVNLGDRKVEHVDPQCGADAHDRPAVAG